MEDYMQELKGQRIWMLWRFEIRKEKRTKVPRSALDGGPSGSDESWSHTWVTYDEAVSARDTYGMDGVGFKIPDGYFFLDVDHRDLDDPLVQKLLTRFDSYAERSVSGGGIHIYGRCDASRIPTSTDANGKVKLDKAYYMKNPHNGVELYYGGITNRFAVFTGNVIWGKPLRDCTEALLATLDEDMRRPEKPAEKKLAKSHDAVFDVVGNLLRQGNADKFRKLYQDGDFSDYGSQSEADCALCAMIAFRTGPDPDMIDRVFRASALMREKWEREDYREATIQKGIEACNGTFHRSKMEHPYFIRFNDDGEAYVVPALLARYVRENVKYLLVRDSGKQALLKYVYDGGVYKLYAEDMFKGVIKGFVEEYDPELVKMRVITEAYQQIITDLQYIGQEELDACETLINFSNCLLRVDARGMTTVPHTPSIYSTIQIPCRWTGKPSPTPVFDRYLHTLTNGDKAVEQLLLEFIGACISNVKGWRMKKALFLVGAGDTGKSQLKSLVERLLGKENFIGIDLKEIEARFGTGVIYGTRLAGSSDMSFLTVDELKTFKKITGGDSLFAEFKGQQGFEYTYNGATTASGSTTGSWWSTVPTSSLWRSRTRNCWTRCMPSGKESCLRRSQPCGRSSPTGIAFPSQRASQPRGRSIRTQTARSSASSKSACALGPRARSSVTVPQVGSTRSTRHGAGRTTTAMPRRPVSSGRIWQSISAPALQTSPRGRRAIPTIKNTR